MGTRASGYSEVGIGVILIVLAVVAFVDAGTMPENFLERGPVGPEAFPRIAGAILLVTGILLSIDALRGGTADRETGEDVDLGSSADWWSVGRIIAAIVVAALLVEPLGWPVAGALLFWSVARALGSRHPVGDPFIGLALSVTSFVVFHLVLGVELPAGPLEGVL